MIPTVLAAVTLDDAGWGALVTIVLALAVRLIRGATAKRESPLEEANRKVMRALADLASAIEVLESKVGRGCVFRDGEIPEHVERWARQILTEAENRRLRGGGRP